MSESGPSGAEQREEASELKLEEASSAAAAAPTAAAAAATEARKSLLLCPVVFISRVYRSVYVWMTVVWRKSVDFKCNLIHYNARIIESKKSTERLRGG